MGTLIKVLFILSISFGLVHGSNLVNQKVYNKKSKEYYLEYKEEWDRLPQANKNRIIKAFKLGQKHNLGFTFAATKFLENRGSDTSYSNKKSIGKNIHEGYITYDCGGYGINTMTYLKSIDKETKKHSAHIAACKKLASDYKLNFKMAKNVYDYALDRYNGSTLKAWNYYNTGRDRLINDRVYKMRGIVMVLKEQLSQSVIKQAENKRDFKQNHKS